MAEATTTAPTTMAAVLMPAESPLPVSGLLEGETVLLVVDCVRVAVRVPDLDMEVVVGRLSAEEVEVGRFVVTTVV